MGPLGLVALTGITVVVGMFAWAHRPPPDADRHHHTATGALRLVAAGLAIGVLVVSGAFNVLSDVASEGAGFARHEYASLSSSSHHQATPASARHRADVADVASPQAQSHHRSKHVRTWRPI